MLFFLCSGILRPITGFEEEIQNFMDTSVVTPLFAAYLSGNQKYSEIIHLELLKVANSGIKEFQMIEVNCSLHHEICLEHQITEFPSFYLYNSPIIEIRQKYNGKIEGESIKKFVIDELDKISHPIIAIRNYGQIVLKDKQFSVPVCSVTLPPSILYGLNLGSQQIGNPLHVQSSIRQFLRIVQSPYCSINYRGYFKYHNMLKFIYDNRFSHIHQYTMREISTYRPDGQLVLLVCDENITDSEIDILHDLSFKFCGYLDIGWISARDEAKTRTLFRHSNSNGSKLIYIDKTREISYSMNKQINYANARKFVLNITTNSILNDRQTDPKWPIALSLVLIFVISFLKVKGGKIYSKIRHRVLKSEFVQYW